jgi:disulfide oxidoreductase YuzD
MQKLAGVIAVLAMSVCAAGQAAQTAKKPCEDLKAEVAKKLDDKGVKGYTLDVVDKGKEGDGKVVGSCDGGTKSIVYSRGGSSSALPEAKKPR